MIIEVKGLLIDHTSKLLLARPAAANSLVLPGLVLQPGTLPPTALAQATREGTGLIVLPVRPTVVTYGRRDRSDYLTLYYRCIMRGGTLQPGGAYAEAGFFDPEPLPRTLPAGEREAIARGLRHAGGPAALMRQSGSMLAAARGLFARPPAPDGPDWSVRVVLAGPSGTGPGLPGRAVNSGEAPWDAAAALWRGPGGTQPLRLTGIYLAEQKAQLTMAFAAATEPPGSATDGLSEPERVIMADAAAANEPTAVRLLPDW